MKLYMAVSCDEYELPLFVEDTVGNLAEKLGRKETTIRSQICRNNKKTKRANSHGYIVLSISV